MGDRRRAYDRAYSSRYGHSFAGVIATDRYRDRKALERLEQQAAAAFPSVKP